MSTAVVIIGIGDWEKYTLPCINSIMACEPRADIIVIDNGSEPAYPRNIDVYRLDETLCYAGAINVGIDIAEERNNDWLLLCNNDVVFNKPFVEFIEMQHPEMLYGFYLHEIDGRQYLSSWAMFLHKTIWNKVGMFDESFKPLGYEDADYCFRAVDMGDRLCGLIREGFGIRHRSSGTKLPHKNLEYLKEKHGIE